MSSNKFTLLLCHENDVGYYVDALIAEHNPLFITMHYTPPYEKFTGLRQLQKQIQQLNPFELARYQPVIDITEWLHHESEDYFAIIVKYLADHTSLWNYILTIRNSVVSDVQPMFLQLRTYMTGRIQEHKFAEQDWLLEAQLISQYNMTESDACLISQIMMQPAFKSYRTQSFLENLVAEIKETSNTATTKDKLHSYMLGDTSLLRMIDEKAVRAVLEIHEGRESK